MDIDDEEFVYRYKRVREEVVANLVQRNEKDHERDLTEALLSGLKNSDQVVDIFCGEDGVKVEVNKQLLVIFSASLRGCLASLGCCDGTPTIILPDFSGESLRNVVEILTNKVMNLEVSSYDDIHKIVDTAKALGVKLSDLKLEQTQINSQRGNEVVAQTVNNVTNNNTRELFGEKNDKDKEKDSNSDDKDHSDSMGSDGNTLEECRNKVAEILGKESVSLDDVTEIEGVEEINSESLGDMSVANNSQSDVKEGTSSSDSEEEIDENEESIGGDVQIVENEYLQNLNLEETLHANNREKIVPVSSDEESESDEELSSSDEEEIDDSEQLKNIKEIESTQIANENKSEELPKDNSEEKESIPTNHDLEIEDEALIEGPANKSSNMTNILDEIKNKIKMKDDISNKVKQLENRVAKIKESPRNISHEESLALINQRISSLTEKLGDFERPVVKHEAQSNLVPENVSEEVIQRLIGNHEVQSKHAPENVPDEIMNQRISDNNGRNNNFKCTICNEVMTKPHASNLKEHISRHFSREIFDRYIGDLNVSKCPVVECGKVFDFKNRLNLVRHLGSSHNKCLEFLEENGVEIPEVLLETQISDNSSPLPESDSDSGKKSLTEYMKEVSREFSNKQVEAILRQRSTEGTKETNNDSSQKDMDFGQQAVRESQNEVNNGYYDKYRNLGEQGFNLSTKQPSKNYPEKEIKTENPDNFDGSEETSFMDKFRCTICHVVMRKSSVSNFKEHFSTAHFRSDIYERYIKHPGVTVCPIEGCGKDFDKNRNNLIRHLGSTHEKCVELLELKGIRVPSVFMDSKRKRAGTVEINFNKKVKVDPPLPPLMGHSIFSPDLASDRYRCDYCDLSFANSGNLKRHQVGKHQDVFT